VGLAKNHLKTLYGPKGRHSASLISSSDRPVGNEKRHGGSARRLAIMPNQPAAAGSGKIS